MQLMEYAVQSRMFKESSFVWWIHHDIQKRNQIIAKIKYRYWTRTHKFEIKTPKTIEMARLYATENCNTLWWDAILKEMSNLRLAFELFNGEEHEIPPDFQ